jgi:hypothetical protein
MNRALTGLASVLAVALFAALLGACAKDAETTKPRASLAPETELTYAPLEGDTSGYRVRLYWNGHDQDGEVVRYRFAIDDDTLETDQSRWKVTTAKDTTLLLLVDPIQAIRGHVFWVAAEDNDSHIDPTPAKRYFSTKTQPPTSEIVRGPSAFNSLIGPNFTFEWNGTDPDGGDTGGPAPVESFEYLLLLIGSRNDPDHPVLPPYDSRFYAGLINNSTGDCAAPPYDDWCWTGVCGNKAQFRNAPSGEYLFALRAVDEAGAREKNLAFIRNIRHFTSITYSPTKPTGPVLTVTSSACNAPLPPAVGDVDFQRSEIQILEGELLSFSWSANADAYGGEIVGFAHALDDIALLPAIDARSTGVTYRPQDLTVGLHFLFVRVVDDGGLATNAAIPFRVIHPSFQDPPSATNPPQFLYVDDALAPGNTLSRFFNFPSDAEEDEWWRTNILVPLSLEFGMMRRDWDTFALGLVNGGGLRAHPRLSDLAAYRVVIWNVDGYNNRVGSGVPTALWNTLVGGIQSELGGYLRAGGTLFLSGSSIATNVVSPTTDLLANFTRGLCSAYAPGTAGYSRTFFPRTMMGVDGARGANEGLRSLGAKDFLEGRVTTLGSQFGYVSAEVDTGITAKWYEKTFGSTDPNVQWAPGLISIEGWRMAAYFNCVPGDLLIRRESMTTPIATPIFTYHGARMGIYQTGYPSPREDLVVGIQVQAHDLGDYGGGALTPANAQGAIGRVVVFGFPLYFVKDGQAVTNAVRAFAYLNGSPTLPPMPMP